MKEKIIRILRIILFDAFKSRWAWRRIPAEFVLKYMNKKKASKLDEIEIPKEYEALLRKSDNKKFDNTLIIVFGTDRYWFTDYLAKKYNVLFLRYLPIDGITWGYSWYIPHMNELVLYIKSIILKYSYTKVICIGQSAYGTASFVYSHVLSGKCPYVQFYTFSFGPDIELGGVWPSEFKKVYANDKETLKTIDAFSTYDFLVKKSKLKRENLFIYIIVGARHMRDCFYAFRLRHCKYLKILDEMDTETHNTSSLLLLSDKYTDNSKKLFNFVRLLKAQDAIADDAQKSVEIVEKARYKNGKRLSSLNELIHELITTNKITSLYKDKK